MYKPGDISEYTFSPRELALLEVTIIKNTNPFLFNQLYFNVLAQITVVVTGTSQQNVCSQAAAYTSESVAYKILNDWLAENTLKYLKSIINEDSVLNTDFLNKIPASDSNSTPAEIIFNEICIGAGNYLGLQFLVDFKTLSDKSTAETIFIAGINV